MPRKKVKSKLTRKRNPLLLTVNPTKRTAKTKKKVQAVRQNPYLREETEHLWQEAKRKAKSHGMKVKRSEFDTVIESFWQQHGELPESISYHDAPHIPKDIKFVADIGKAEKLYYTPRKPSRKNPFKYVHEAPKTHFVSDQNGYIHLVGPTVLKKDGWMHH